MRMLDTLDIRKSKVIINQTDTRIIKFRKRNTTTSQDILDFWVNGKNLRDLIQTSYNSAPELSTGLQSNFVVEERRKYINRLLGKTPADLASGRVALLICPIDGDLECGAVGCRIQFDNAAKTVIWYDFAWDGDSSDEESEPDEKVEGFDSFTFDELEYRWLMLQILQDLSVRGEIKP